MTVIYNTNGNIRVTTPHDPDSIVMYTLQYKAFTWSPGKVLHKDDDIIIPTVDTGLSYIVTSSGVTSATEPTWATKEQEIMSDNTVEYKAQAYDFLLGFNDVITASQWAASDQAITLNSSGIHQQMQTFVLVSTVPDTLLKFTLTNTVDVLRSDGTTEKFEKSMIVKVSQH